MADNLGSNSRAELKALADRVDRLEDEKQQISDAIRDVFGEAKAKGFDVKQLRKAIKVRRQDQAKRREEEAILDMYLHVLGVLSADEAAHGSGGGISATAITDTAKRPFAADDDGLGIPASLRRTPDNKLPQQEKMPEIPISMRATS